MNKLKLNSTVRAKECIDNLLCGTNPFTDKELKDGSIVIDEKLKACFSYISDILEIVIKKHDEIDKYVRIKNVPISEIIEQMQFSDSPISLTELAHRVNNVLSTVLGIELKVTEIIKWLIKNDILQLIGNRSVLGVRSGEFEITTERRKNMNGVEYTAILYGIKAQQFVVENITEILLDERL